MAFSTLVVDFAREQGAKAIVKGLRAISDFEYEFEMHQLNRLQAPDIDTLYLMAARSTVSSARAGSRNSRCSVERSTNLSRNRWRHALKEELGR